MPIEVTHTNLASGRVVSFATLLLPPVLAERYRGGESDAGIENRREGMVLGFRAPVQ
jgi:hypothetical protein